MARRSVDDVEQSSVVGADEAACEAAFTCPREGDELLTVAVARVGEPDAAIGCCDDVVGGC